jgi:hypothetical protein
MTKLQLFAYVILPFLLILFGYIRVVHYEWRNRAEVGGSRRNLVDGLVRSTFDLTQMYANKPTYILVSLIIGIAFGALVVAAMKSKLF